MQLPERSLLVVVDETVLDHGEDGITPIWIMNNQLRGNPIPISTCSPPRDRDCQAVGGHFGPRNPRKPPRQFCQRRPDLCHLPDVSVRVYDIRDPFRPKKVGACVRAAPMRMVDPRPSCAAVLHSADVFVDARGLVYVTDFNAGLSIIEFPG